MITILYGSQTGTAEEIAFRVARQARCRSGLDCEVMPMDEVDFGSLPTKSTVIFICSTTGEGEMPDNMKRFWKWLLLKEHPVNNFLADVSFAVFGNGDSSYEHFNYAAKKLFRRLVQLGARPLLDRADGDDQHALGYEGALSPWLTQLHALLGGTGQPVPFQVRAELVPSNGQSEHVVLTNAQLISKDQVCEADADVKDVLSIRFSCSLEYEPGDVAVLRPENSDEEIQALLEVIGWTGQADDVYSVNVNRRDEFRPPADFPLCFTLRTLLKRYFDLNRPPSRYFFEVLRDCVQPDHPLAEAHRQKLSELGTDYSSEGQTSYLDYVWRPKRKPAEVIGDFSSLSIPLGLVFELFPWIRPRSFSIASYAPRKEIVLLVALVRYKTIMKDERVGLCSQWMETLPLGSSVPLSVSKGTMPLGQLSADSPLVLMCAGTGLAPMLSIIERVKLMPVKPKVYLFFGCRKVGKDSFFLGELKNLEWLQVFCVGSRDGARGASKVYLQGILTSQYDLVSGLLLDPKSRWFLSGNSKLPGAVKKVLAGIIQDVYRLDGPEFIRQMALSGRFHSETWS